MLVLLALLACDSTGLEAAASDAGASTDDTGAPSADGGSDGGAEDGGAADGGTTDGGTTDGGTTDGGTADGGTADGGSDGGGSTGMDAFEECFEEISGDTGGFGPQYAEEMVIGSHCHGTDHQDIDNVERVVFLGDSVTVGTLPTDAGDWWRNLLADELSAEFGLSSPGWFWENVNLVDGTTYIVDDGDFSSCAKWGARTDDLMQDNDQVITCLPEDEWDKETLVVMTIGGNDLNSLTEGFMDGEDVDDLWEQTFDYMALMRESVEWIKEDGRFENGVHVVFTNLYEFTDATGDVTSCPLAGLAGYDAAVTDPALEEMVVWSMEEFMQIAVDTDSDMLFLLEAFCGHGYARDDETGRCYRGPEAELWFDETCIHPNAAGHDAIYEMFTAVIYE